MFIENLFGWIALITSVIGLLPQVYKAVKTQSTTDVSMLMLINYLVCSFAWIIYGKYTNSLFVTLSNVLGLLSSFLLILLKIVYDRRHSRLNA